MGREYFESMLYHHVEGEEKGKGAGKERCWKRETCANREKLVPKALSLAVSQGRFGPN